jgi:hypothetical protein
MGLEHLLDPSGRHLAQSSTSSSIKHLPVHEKGRLVEADRSSPSSARPDEMAEPQLGHRARHAPSQSNSVSEQPVPEKPPLAAPDHAITLETSQYGRNSTSKSLHLPPDVTKGRRPPQQMIRISVLLTTASTATTASRARSPRLLLRLLPS